MTDSFPVEGWKERLLLAPHWRPALTAGPARAAAESLPRSSGRDDELEEEEVL